MLCVVTGDVPELSTESSAGFSKTSLSEIVDTPMQSSNSDTASDGWSSRMVKKTSGGGTEPGSRKRFQLISARGMAAECLPRSPTELRALPCMGLSKQFFEGPHRRLFSQIGNFVRLECELIALPDQGLACEEQ